MPVHIKNNTEISKNARLTGQRRLFKYLNKRTEIENQFEFKLNNN